jgi:hypothetical protein
MEMQNMSDSFEITPEMHNQQIDAYVQTNMPKDWLWLDMDKFRHKYHVFIAMEAKEFFNHNHFADDNLNRLKDKFGFRLYTYHSMKAAIPFMELKANDEFKRKLAKYDRNMEEMAERMRQMGQAMCRGDPNDEDPRVRAGTHKRITVSTETGAGKGRCEPVDYIVPNDDFDSDCDSDGGFD